VLGFTILIPLLPFVAKHFGAPDAVAGSLITTSALCATLSSPLWGRLSDVAGRKRALLGSQAASFGGYLVLAFAGNLEVLFLSRIIEGLGGGSLGVATAYISDVTSEELRPQALAYASAAFGAGFIAGPVLGGALAHYGFALPFFVAAGLQAANFALTLLLLPESHAPAPARRDSWRELGLAMRRAALRGALLCRFLYIFAFTFFFTSFSLFLNGVLHAGPEMSSFLLAIAGGTGALTQIFAVGPLTKRFGLRAVTLAAFGAGVVAYALLGFAMGLAFFIAVIVIWAFSGSVLRPALDARIAGIVPANERGTFLGLADSLDNFSMIFAPTLGAAVVGIAPRLMGVAPGLALAAGFLVYRRLR
jgi:DHA1 family tetracycline resistance protein-like MFS transporter